MVTYLSDKSDISLHWTQSTQMWYKYNVTFFKILNRLIIIVVFFKLDSVSAVIILRRVLKPICYIYVKIFSVIHHTPSLQFVFAGMILLKSSKVALLNENPSISSATVTAWKVFSCLSIVFGEGTNHCNNAKSTLLSAFLPLCTYCGHSTHMEKK